MKPQPPPSSRHTIDITESIFQLAAEEAKECCSTNEDGGTSSPNGKPGSSPESSPSNSC